MKSLRTSNKGTRVLSESAKHSNEKKELKNMSPPVPKPQMNKQEQETFERMKKACAKHGSKSTRMKETCAMLKAQQIQEYEQKQAELKAIALQNLNARRQEGITYVIAKVNKLQNEGALLSNALQKASGEYDMILKSKAASPIFGEILVTLLLTVLPELKVVGRAAGTFTTKRAMDLSKIKLGKSLDDNWTALGTELQKKVKIDASNARITKFADYLDNQSKDIIEAIKNPLGANADVDAETKQRLAAFTAKNQILTEIINSIAKRLVQANFLEPILYKFILWYEGEDLVPFLKTIFNLIGFDAEIAYDVKVFDLFSDLILYDMLRAYTKQYFSVKAQIPGMDSSVVTVDNYKNPSESEINGLDSAQRKMIYQKFGKVTWGDTTRPPVNNWRDLIKVWGGTFEMVYVGGGI
jgi:hypothetical protein